MCTVRSASRNCCSGGERAQLRRAEVFGLELRVSVGPVLPLPERGIVDAGAQRGRGDLRAGEEALEAAVEQRRVAKAHRVLPKVVPVSGRRSRQAIDEPGHRTQRPDHRPPALHQLRGALPLVAGEELVAAFAAQHDLHVLRGEPRQEPDRHRRGGRARLVERALHGGKDIRRRHRLHRQHDVLAAEVVRDAPRGLRFVDGGVRKADRERLDPVARGSRHRRRHRAGVDAAREKCADRHIRQHVPLDGLQHPLARLLDPVVLRHAFANPEARLPERMAVAPPVGPRCKDVPGSRLAPAGRSSAASARGRN